MKQVKQAVLAVIASFFFLSCFGGSYQYKTPSFLGGVTINRQQVLLATLIVTAQLKNEWHLQEYFVQKKARIAALLVPHVTHLSLCGYFFNKERKLGDKGSTLKAAIAGILFVYGVYQFGNDMWKEYKSNSKVDGGSDGK